MADFTGIQGESKIAIDWYTVAKQFDGTVEFVVFLDAEWGRRGCYGCGWFCESQRVFRVVL